MHAGDIRGIRDVILPTAWSRTSTKRPIRTRGWARVPYRRPPHPLYRWSESIVPRVARRAGGITADRCGRAETFFRPAIRFLLSRTLAASCNSHRSISPTRILEFRSRHSSASIWPRTIRPVMRDCANPARTFRRVWPCLAPSSQVPPELALFGASTAARSRPSATQ